MFETTNAGSCVPISTDRSPHGVEEAMPTLPPESAKREVPATAMDDEEVIWSETAKKPETVEDAREMKPELKSESPEKEEVEDALMWSCT